MGSTVTATKPIAITLKDDLMSGAAFGGCADLGGDQIVPIDYIGTKYVVVRGFLNAPFDKVFVMATQNNTTINVDGVFATTINSGQTYMVDMPAASRYIESSSPVYVLQLSGFGCELGISILPPIECTGSTSVAITRSTNEDLFLNLIVRTGGQNNFLFNGAAGIINGATFAPVPGSGGTYQFAQVTINTAQLGAGAAAIVSNTSDFFHLGIIHGTGTGGTRFGYFSNFNKIEVTADGFSIPVCEGFPIQLNANSVFASATFAWSGPNSFTSATKNPVISNAQPVNAGDYIVVATVSGCPSVPDTVPVTVINCGTQISGVVNTYTAVSAIDICTNSVTVGSTAGFAVGSRVMLIQMKGAQINTSNTTAFGDVTSYDNAGNYEFGYIASINGNQITLVNALQKTYDPAGAVQLIYVPQYSGNAYTVNTPVTCLPWNGSIGGVVAFEVAGILTLNADVTASSFGFRAGAANDNSPFTCDQQDYFYPSNSPFGGRKGEGIHELPLNIINGRGKNANGGGGGNDTNSGGAGGGNSGSGGRGGNQWTGCSNIPIGGDGGANLLYNNASNKIFLGGGAGGGHQNDATATPGTNGGGIIFISSNSINSGTGTIRSSSLDAVQAATDGSGGAGAGGTVLINTNSVAGSLLVDVHGGKGGDNNTHGTGGGGGGGIVWTSIPLPANVTTNLLGGQPGFHSSTNSSHGAGAGGNGSVLSGLTIVESTTPFTPLAKPVATAPGNVCEGSDINLNVGTIANVTYNWSGPNGFNSSLQNPTVNNASQLASGDYIVAIENTLGCIERDTVTISVPPIYTLLRSDTICSGNSFTLPSGTIVNAAGQYTDTLLTSFGCDSIIITDLIVLAAPTTVIDTLICPGTTYILPSGNSVQTAGSYTSTLSAVNGCDSIVVTNLLYHPVYTTLVNDTICSGDTYTLPDGNTANQAGLYNIILTSINGCDSTISITLTVLNVNLSTQTTNISCFGLNDGQVQITANGGVAIYTFTSTSGASLSGNASVNFTNLAPGTYTIDVIDSKGCQASINATVTEPAQLVTQALVTNVTCFGFSDGQVQLSATGGSLPFTYLMNGATNSNGLFSDLAAGNYTATIIDAANCSSTTNFSVAQPDAVTLQFQPQKVEIKLGESSSAGVSSNYDPNVVYAWSPTTGLSCFDCSNPEINSVNDITYTVQAVATINGNECTATEQLVVTIIPNYDLFIPNAFSPNSDGANDFFMLYGNIPAIKQLQLMIFNRWGEKVYETNNINFQWDGTFKNAPLPPGVYTYAMNVVFLDNYTDANLKGSLTLIK
jgi:gliding motility-associated-like protein